MSEMAVKKAFNIARGSRDKSISFSQFFGIFSSLEELKKSMARKGKDSVGSGGGTGVTRPWRCYCRQSRVVIRLRRSKFRQICLCSTKNFDNNDVFLVKIPTIWYNFPPKLWQVRRIYLQKLGSVTVCSDGGGISAESYQHSTWQNMPKTADLTIILTVLTSRTYMS